MYFVRKFRKLVNWWFDVTNKYLVQLIKHQILRIPDFNFPNLRCCKVFFFLFNITSNVGIFWVYFDINLKLLSGKNTNKVSKQNIQDPKNRNLEFLAL